MCPTTWTLAISALTFRRSLRTLTLLEAAWKFRHFHVIFIQTRLITHWWVQHHAWMVKLGMFFFFSKSFSNQNLKSISSFFEAFQSPSKSKADKLKLVILVWCGLYNLREQITWSKHMAEQGRNWTPFADLCLAWLYTWGLFCWLSDSNLYTDLCLVHMGGSDKGFAK